MAISSAITNQVGEIISIPTDDSDEVDMNRRSSNSSIESVSSSCSGYCSNGNDRYDQLEEQLKQEQRLTVEQSKRIIELSGEKLVLINEITNLRDILSAQAEEIHRLKTGIGSTNVVDLELYGSGKNGNKSARNTGTTETISLAQLRTEAKSLHDRFIHLIAKMEKRPTNVFIENNRKRIKCTMDVFKEELNSVFEKLDSKLKGWVANQWAVKAELDRIRTVLEKQCSDFNDGTSTANGLTTKDSPKKGPTTELLTLNYEMETVDATATTKQPNQDRSKTSDNLLEDFENYDSILRNLLTDKQIGDGAGKLPSKPPEVNVVEVEEEDDDIMELPPLPPLNFPLGTVPGSMGSTSTDTKRKLAANILGGNCNKDKVNGIVEVSKMQAVAIPPLNESKRKHVLPICFPEASTVQYYFMTKKQKARQGNCEPGLGNKGTMNISRQIFTKDVCPVQYIESRVRYFTNEM